MKPIAVLFITVFFSFNVFAGSAQQFGKKPKPSINEYEREAAEAYIQCIEEELAEGGDLDFAEGMCEEYLDAVSGPAAEKIKEAARERFKSDPASAGKYLSISTPGSFESNIVMQLDPMFGGGGSSLSEEEALYQLCISVNEGSGLSEKEIVAKCEAVVQEILEKRSLEEGDKGIEDSKGVPVAGGGFDPMFRQIDPAFMKAGEGQGRVVIVATENGQEVLPEPVFKLALDTINNSPLEITPEGVLAAGSVVAGAALIWRYGRSMNPIGAFIAGLGIGPAAASDYCSRYNREEGLKIYLNLDQETQLSEAKMCPELAGQVLTISESLK